MYVRLLEISVNPTININTKGIYADLKNLVESPEGIKQLADNYLEIYDELVKK